VITLDGNLIASQVKSDIKNYIDDLRKKAGSSIPGLGTILVGDDPASQSYVAGKLLPQIRKSAALSTRSTEIPVALVFFCNFHCPINEIISSFWKQSIRRKIVMDCTQSISAN
jgi:hypothetical protein